MILQPVASEISMQLEKNFLATGAST